MNTRPIRVITAGVCLLALAFTVTAQENAITNAVRASDGLLLSWDFSTNRVILARASSVNGPYAFVSAVLTSRTSNASNDQPASIFRVQRVAVVSIPDTNLAKGVRAALTTKVEPTNEVYDFETATITNLNLVGKGITNLAGLEATSLTLLNLSLNNLSDLLPLAGLTTLTRLDLFDNQVTNLTPLAGLVGLTFLDFSYNEVSDVGPVSNLTQLTQLSLIQNQVTDLAPLSGLIRLQNLGLNNNMITNVDALVALTNLTALYLAGNQIVDVGALVTNALDGGLGTGDLVTLQGNPLSVYAKTVAIPDLTNRGVIVSFDP